MSRLTLEDRIKGCLLGGAIGDAIGAHFEGRAAIDDSLVPANLYITDDTQLTIATCEAIVESGSVNPEAIANSFLRWFRHGRIHGIGSTTLKSLTELDAGGHWALVGGAGERSAGNGAAMRIAPLAFLLDPAIDADRQMLRDVCRITHRNEEAYIGALSIVQAIRHVINGARLDSQFLNALIGSLPDSSVRDRLSEIRDGSLSVMEYATRFSTSGYVVDSVPLAILAAMQSEDLIETIDQIVRCGGDTDSIASMCGQIWGAAMGVAALPVEIVEQIDAAELVRETAAAFAQTSIAMIT